MEFIVVRDKKETVHLPVKKNVIKLKTLKTYFPNASELIYMLGGKKCGMDENNGELTIIPSIKEYEVYYPNILKENNKITAAKKKKIDEIMEVLQGNKANKDTENEIILQNPKAKKKDLKKNLFVGWKHRENKLLQYKQMSTPYGGIQRLELDQVKEYTYGKIKQLCIQIMKNNLNRHVFETSIIQLGNYDNKIYTTFTDSCGLPCDFWEFSHNLRGRNSQLRLYLFTEPESAGVCLSIRDKQNQINEKSSTKCHSLLGSKNDCDFSTMFPPPVNFNYEEKMNSSKRKNSTSSTDVSKSVKKQKVFENSSKKSSLNTNGPSWSLNNNVRSRINLISNRSTSKEKHDNLPIHNSAIYITESSRSMEPNSDTNILDVLRFSTPFISKDEINFTSTELGRGAFGTVIKATWNCTEVAVKKIEFSTNNKYVFRELNAMDKVRHPNIISIMAIAMTDTNCCIVMEYFESNTLKHLLFKTKVKINEAKKNLIALQMCKAITYLHKLIPPIIHKDLKPENVLVNEQYIVKICDLGLSKVCESISALNTTIGQNFHGTPLYMPPETLIHNMPGTIHSDVWSLACSIVELFSEKYVWKSVSVIDLKQTILKEKIPNLLNVPTYLHNILNKCFDHVPNKRPDEENLLQVISLHVNEPKITVVD